MTTLAQEATAAQALANLEVQLRATRSETIAKIMREAHCTTGAAIELIEYVMEIVTEARRHNYLTVHLTDEALSSPVYEFFNLVCQHGITAQPGSAHEALQNILLNPATGERGFVHQMYDVDDGVADCNVAFDVIVLPES